MEKIGELFERLHARLDETMDLKTCQEFHVLAKELLRHADGRHEWEQREQTQDHAFFCDANVRDPLSFGQCGDRVYFKIIDGVLYISGEGPMWNFDNTPGVCAKKEPSSPWRESDFCTVMIENGVTSIGADAFHGMWISDIIISSGVKKIGEMAFFDAKIERLVLPGTLETVEEGILCGFSRVADTLVVSADIADIRPLAFFNRDDAVANTVILTGNLPDDLTPLAQSCLFDDAGICKIYYPAKWDTETETFYEKLLPKCVGGEDGFAELLAKVLSTTH